jgi:hypothetical protein
MCADHYGILSYRVTLHSTSQHTTSLHSTSQHTTSLHSTSQHTTSLHSTFKGEGEQKMFSSSLRCAGEGELAVSVAGVGSEGGKH